MRIVTASRCLARFLLALALLLGFAIGVGPELLPDDTPGPRAAVERSAPAPAPASFATDADQDPAPRTALSDADRESPPHREDDEHGAGIPGFATDADQDSD